MIWTCTHTHGYTDNDCVLLAPHKVIETTERQRTHIANVLAAWYSIASSGLRPHIPTHLEHWGRVQRLDGGDTMHAAELSTGNGRDMTFVRVSDNTNYSQLLTVLLQYELNVDIHRRNHQRAPEFVRHTFYGQLKQVLVLPIQGQLADALGQPNDGFIILAAIAGCDNVSKDNGYTYYKGLKGVELVNLKTIENVIGRVPTHRAGEFGIVDRSGALSRVLFTEADDDES
jgi:hypothetical protein